MQTYFISRQGSSLVKIGKSKDPAKRLVQLQTASPDQLQLLITIEGDWEFDYHYVFANDRCVGKWFNWSESRTNLVYFIVTGRGKTAHDSLLNLCPVD